MRNIKFCVPKDIEEKILYKHGIELDELNKALEYGNPKILNQGERIYMAITHHMRYITIIFEYKKHIATVITAYPSSDSHIRRYNRK